MGANGDGEGNGATVTVGAGGVVGLEQAASAKPISITIDRRMSLSDTYSTLAQQPRQLGDIRRNPPLPQLVHSAFTCNAPLFPEGRGAFRE